MAGSVMARGPRRRLWAVSAACAWSVSHRQENAVATARGITATGTGVWPHLVALGAGVIAGRTARDRLRWAAVLVGALAVGQAERYAVMRLAARPRPAFLDWTTHASGYSFPSGHTATSPLAAGLVCGAAIHRAQPVAARAACAVAVCWAATIGLPRTYLGVRWATDVVGGWLFAVAWVAAAAALCHPFLSGDREGTASRITAGSPSGQ
jgi:membrane-associated phospholipid phosphatase